MPNFHVKIDIGNIIDRDILAINVNINLIENARNRNLLNNRGNNENELNNNSDNSLHSFSSNFSGKESELIVHDIEDIRCNNGYDCRKCYK